MRYFLPSFKDWLQTFWVLFLSGIWGAIATNWPADTYRFLAEHLDFVWGWLLFNLVLIPVMGFTYTHWFLWGRENTGLPWWLPSLHSWGEGLWQWAISLVGWLIPFAGIVAFDLFVMGIGVFEGDRVAFNNFLDRNLGIQTAIVLIFWILFVGECWMIRRRLTQWWKKRKEEKGGSSTPTE